MVDEIIQKLMIMIDWANLNSGFLLVLLTAVYVLATVAILSVMTWSNKLLRKSIEQTAEIERARIRPYLSIFLKHTKSKNSKSMPSSPTGYLFLKNSGLSYAYKVSITMTPQIYSECMRGSKKTKIVPFFVDNETPSIAPGEKLSDFLGFLSEIYSLFENPVFKGQISYFDAFGTEYEDNFILNLVFMRKAVTYVEDVDD
jgi:hypothetical protein